MPFRIIMFFLITVWLLYLVYSIKRQKGKEFAQTLRLFLTSIVVVLGGLALADYSVKQEKADYYNADRDLRRFKSLADIDPNMLNGIENIPPHAKIKENYDSTYLVAPKGQFFTWGPFRLNSIPLDSAYIRFNEEDLVHHSSQPINIHGTECKTTSSIELRSKQKNLSGVPFSAFELAGCMLEELTLHIENQTFKLADPWVRFYSSQYELRRYDNYLQSFAEKLPNMRKLTNSNKPFHFVTQHEQIKLQLRHGYIVTDTNENLLLISGRLSICEQSNDCNTPKEPYQLGNCTYPPLAEVYIINLKQGMADWYFVESGDAIKEECKMQRLPYFIEPINDTK